jgi:hypothetical protein
LRAERTKSSFLLQGLKAASAQWAKAHHGIFQTRVFRMK